MAESAQDGERLFDRKLMTMAEVTDLLRVTRATVYRLMREGELTRTKVGGQLRFDTEEVRKLAGLKG